MSPNVRPLRAVAGVALWLVDLDARDLAEPALSAEEEARAAHFAFERDRGRYFAAHRALRRLLATQSGLDARALRFVAGPYGKPALDGAPRCRFSLADCDDVALIGIVTGDEDVGVDVERVRPVPDRFDLAASLFTPAEQAELRSVPPPRRDQAFLRGWTRKEACLKAVGTGLVLEARQVEAGLAPLERRLTIAAPHGRFAVEVHSIEMGDALVAAVARVRPPSG